MTKSSNCGGDSDDVVQREARRVRRNGRSTDAETLRRIVEVAQRLGADPQMVRIALEDESGQVRTDVSVRESTEIVDDALNRGGRAFKPASRRS